MKTEGWFIYASSHEFGPTLFKYNKEGKPTKRPEVGVEGFRNPDYKDWDEVWLFGEYENRLGCTTCRPEQEFNPVFAEIRVVTKGREE